MLKVKGKRGENVEGRMKGGRQRRLHSLYEEGKGEGKRERGSMGWEEDIRLNHVC